MMSLLNEYELAFGVLPNEPGSNQVIYIESHKNALLEAYVKENLQKLKEMFSQHGLEFIYLPEWIDDLSADKLEQTIRYYLPWYHPTDLDKLKESCRIRIEDLQKELAPRTGEPATVNGKGRAFRITVDKPTLFYEQFRQIAEAYSKRETSQVLFREARVADDIPPYGEPEKKKGTQMRQVRGDLLHKFMDLEDLFELAKDSIDHDVIKKALLQLIKEGKDEVISRLEIGWQSNLVLPDYNISIDLYPVEMALYILILRHPEGVRFTHLVNYRRELLNYYGIYSRKENPEEAIDNLIDTQNNNTANINRSRIQGKINRALKDAFCYDYSKYYMITGGRDEPKKVLLPADKIVWKIKI